MIAIFLVVKGLQHAAGIVSIFATLFSEAVLLPSVLAVIAPSLLVTVGASAINNWPMTMLGLISVENVMNTITLSEQNATILIFANIIGNNLGPHFFPLGSLAILMWLSVIRRKGLDIGLREYVKVGSILSIVQVVTASLILWIEVIVWGITMVPVT